jgi:hypothetical protein
MVAINKIVQKPWIRIKMSWKMIININSNWSRNHQHL